MTMVTKETPTMCETKKMFIPLVILYFMIGFEILYMISPFAFYYYSVYGEGLNFLSEIPAVAWLTRFLLPHYSETTSAFLNILGPVGWMLSIIGMLSFFVGAGQIYYNKFTRKGAVTGGIYRFIRHPQYVSLGIWGLGLLLVWPRWIVLISFITMVFVYYFLAKAEEQRCEREYGHSYLEYKQRTGMFLPFAIPKIEKFSAVLPKGGMRPILVVLLYVISLLAANGLAAVLRNYSVEKLSVYYAGNAANISVINMEEARLKEILSIASKSATIQTRFASLGNAKLINYVMPTMWYLGDIPMNMEGHNGGHITPKDHDPDRFRIVYTQAVINDGSAVSGKTLILNAANRIPLFQVEVDLKGQSVLRIVEIPKEAMRWTGFPTPIF